MLCLWAWFFSPLSLRLSLSVSWPCTTAPGTGPAQDKHALLDVTPSAIERLNYVQYYPIVVFCVPESRTALKALRQWLAPASRRSSRRLYAQAQKLRKYSDHLFTGGMGAEGLGWVVGPGLSLLAMLMPRPCSHHPPARYE